MRTDGVATQQCIASSSLGADAPPICRFGNEEDEDMFHLAARDVAWRPLICEDPDDRPSLYDDEGATTVALDGPTLHGFDARIRVLVGPPYVYDRSAQVKREETS